MILIAEDQKVVAEMLQREIVRFFGDKISKDKILIAHDLKTAISIAQIRPEIKIVLLDLVMDDADTQKTLSTIPLLSANGRYVIVLSGSGSEETRREAKRHGAYDYIEKPIVTELLMNQMARLLERISPEHEDAAVHVQQRAQRSLVEKVNAVSAEDTTRGASFRKWLPAIASITAILAFAFVVYDRWRGGVLSASGLERRVATVEKRLSDMEFAVQQIGRDIGGIRTDIGALREADAKSLSQREAVISEVGHVRSETAEVRKTVNEIWRLLAENKAHR